MHSVPSADAPSDSCIYMHQNTREGIISNTYIYIYIYLFYFIFFYFFFKYIIIYMVFV